MLAFAEKFFLIALFIGIVIARLNYMPRSLLRPTANGPTANRAAAQRVIDGRHALRAFHDLDNATSVADSALQAPPMLKYESTTNSYVEFNTDGYTFP